MDSGPNDRRTQVASQFHRAHRQASLEVLLSRLSGHPVDLLSYNDVIDKLGIAGHSRLGVRQIPLDAIVGSVGRYQDFTRTFLPRSKEDEERWVSVASAATSVADLPPIEVYKIGDVYFVLDGNHRVSLARGQALEAIAANVIEVRTRVPMPPGGKPDDLIVAAEMGAFLDYTHLDELRPEADFRVSIPGQYRHLQSHIEAYRFACELDKNCELPPDEATERWYDEVYLPLVEAIREQGILRYFPGRTETDFFVWLAHHRAEVEKALGYEIAPDVAVSRLLSRVEEAAEARRTTLADRLRRFARLTITEQPPAMPQRTWAQERALDRYSRHLFAGMVYPVVLSEGAEPPDPNDPAFARAVALCREEEATLCVLGITPDQSAAETASLEAYRGAFEAAAIHGELLIDSGDPLHLIKEVGFLNDLVIINRSFAAAPTGGPSPSTTTRAIIEQLNRPVLLLGASVADPFPRRVLVVHDTRRPMNEAMFIAAYLAERWGCELGVLPLDGGDTQAAIEETIRYLDLHEVTATFMEPIRPGGRAVEQIIQSGIAGDFDLLLVAGPNRDRKTNKNNNSTEPVWGVLEHWPRSTLIAT